MSVKLFPDQVTLLKHLSTHDYFSNPLLKELIDIEKLINLVSNKLSNQQIPEMTQDVLTPILKNWNSNKKFTNHLLEVINNCFIEALYECQ